MHTAALAFYLGAGDLNSGPHTHTAGIFPWAISPAQIFQFFIFIVNVTHAWEEVVCVQPSARNPRTLKLGLQRRQTGLQNPHLHFPSQDVPEI